MTAGLVRIRSGRVAAPGGLPSCCMILHRRGCLRMLCHVVLFHRICHSPRREAYIASGTGISRLWQGCPIPAAPWLVRLTSAAGIPLKSVGGRSWGCVSPALSSRPMLPCIGSKAAYIARTAARPEGREVCRHGGAPFVAWLFSRAGSVLIPVSMRLSRSRGEKEEYPSHIPQEKTGKSSGC